NAGSDQTLIGQDAASLLGTASDDGQPSTLFTSWSKVRGPGSVSFANPSSRATTPTFSESGVYVLKLSATDGELSAADEITVAVQMDNQAPVVDAGPDQTIELARTASAN